MREAIRPRFEPLSGILRRFLSRGRRPKLHALAFTVIGQCLHYKMARAITERLIGAEAYAARPRFPDRPYQRRSVWRRSGISPLDRTGQVRRQIPSLAEPADRTRWGRRGEMSWIALKMLVGDKAKFFGIVMGLTFAALLITQQGSIFCGLMLRTAGQITDITGADLWVMDPNVRYIDDVKPMIENNLYRVRGVEGVLWAVPLYKGNGRAKLNSIDRDGAKHEVIEQVILLGLDDTSLVGRRRRSGSSPGKPADLRKPDAVIVDYDRLRKLYPGRRLGGERSGQQARGRGRSRSTSGSRPRAEMNDHRAVIVGDLRGDPDVPVEPRRLHDLYRGPSSSPRRNGRSSPTSWRRPSPDATPTRRRANHARRTGLQGRVERGVHVDDHELLPEVYGHPDQLRHHGAAWIPGRDRRSPARRSTTSRSRTSSSSAR